MHSQPFLNLDKLLTSQQPAGMRSIVELYHSDKASPSFSFELATFSFIPVSLDSS